LWIAGALNPHSRISKKPTIEVGFFQFGFPDPAKATGTEGKVMRAFRNVWDDIANQIHLAQIPLVLNNYN
jgi:hypothetical protein